MKANWLNWTISLYSSTVIFVIREREKYIRYILQCHGLGYNPDAVLPAWSTPKGCSGPLNPNPSMERVWARRLVHMHWGAVICDDSVGLPIDPRRSGAESSLLHLPPPPVWNILPYSWQTKAPLLCIVLLAKRSLWSWKMSRVLEMNAYLEVWLILSFL